MTLSLSDQWVWDFWLTERKVEELWHIYFLQAPKSLIDPEARHANATIGHATSADLINWDYHGTVLKPGSAGSWNDRAIWTGSILQAYDKWFIFFTGTNKSHENGLIQRVGVATSTDLYNWKMETQITTEADALWYERINLKNVNESLVTNGWYEEAWRDPWVSKNLEDDNWIMLTTARKNSGPPDGRGVIGVATSENLLDWQIQPPISAGEEFGHFEVPQFIKFDDGSVGITFCLSDRNHAQSRVERGAPIWTGNGVMRAKNPAGPWIVDEEPFLGLPHYAARIIRVEDRYLALSWINYVDGIFQGYIADPIDVTQALSPKPQRSR